MNQLLKIPEGFSFKRENINIASSSDILKQLYAEARKAEVRGFEGLYYLCQRIYLIQ